MEKYEIPICNNDNFATIEPKQKIIITKEQLEVIETFVNTIKDNKLNTIYILNQCEFKIIPHIVWQND